jgi:hypothetical protein
MLLLELRRLYGRFTIPLNDYIRHSLLSQTLLKYKYVLVYPLGRITKIQTPNKIINYILTPTEIRKYKFTPNLSFPLKINTQFILPV